MKPRKEKYGRQAKEKAKESVLKSHPTVPFPHLSPPPVTFTTTPLFLTPHEGGVRAEKSKVGLSRGTSPRNCNKCSHLRYRTCSGF
jgi:hypothetical protein